MGILLQFPKIHRKEILLHEQREELMRLFTEEAKQLDLTWNLISAMPPIPRNVFPLTIASLLRAERRGALPMPIIHRGKSCYSAQAMAEKALSKWFLPYGLARQAKVVALSVSAYRDGNPMPLVVGCYSKRWSTFALLELGFSIGKVMTTEETGLTQGQALRYMNQVKQSFVQWNA